jgi:hypothetical protein
MPNTKEADLRVIGDLVYEFVSKKRLVIPNYNYSPTYASDEHFKEAAILCEKFKLHPAKYIDIMWSRMGEKFSFFSSSHIRGPGANNAIKEYFEAGGNYEVEITYANLDYNAVWAFQKELVVQYSRTGATFKDILTNSSLKFPAWFRILATENREPDIVDKYKHIARKELSNALLDFIKENNLDLSRITD